MASSLKSEIFSNYTPLSINIVRGIRRQRTGCYQTSTPLSSQILEGADEIVDRIAVENHLPLEDSKHERLVLRDKRRKKNAEVKWVKWLGIIMDESLTLKEHWKARIQKARAMLAQFNRLGNSQWGISATSWRQIYTGLIRAVALWGSELG